MKKVLFLCTGNSCRSQMAEGFLNQHQGFQAFSAGTKPAKQVHPFAVEVMQDLGIDIRGNKPKLVDKYLAQPFDAVVTVCDSAKETCPLFLGKVANRFHQSFEDPDGYGIEKFYEVRDKIAAFISDFVIKMQN